MESRIYDLCNEKVISEINSDYNNYTGIITLYKKGYITNTGTCKDEIEYLTKKSVDKDINYTINSLQKIIYKYIYTNIYGVKDYKKKDNILYI